MPSRCVFIGTLLLCGCSSQPSLQNRSGFTSFDRVVMHRSGCYGRCPIYTVSVTAKGTVRFHGEQFVAFSGLQSGSTSKSQLAVLDRELGAIDFFSLRHSYGLESDGCTELWTDNPSVEIEVFSGDRRYKVEYYYGCTIEIGTRLDALSRTIDRVTHARNWVAGGAP